MRYYWLEEATPIAFLQALIDSGLFAATSAAPGNKCADCRLRPTAGIRTPYCVGCRQVRRQRHRARADANRDRSRKVKCPTCDGMMRVESRQCYVCHALKRVA